MGDEDRRTLWCGNLPEKANEELLYELFLQAGPLEMVTIPKDRDGRQRNFGFVTYVHEISVPYAIELFRGTEIFQRILSLQARAGQGSRYQQNKVDLPPMRDFPIVPPDVPRQFEEMASHLAFNNALPNVPYIGKTNLDRPDRLPNLSVASLQGNWSTRHHPYQRDEFQNNKGRFNSKHRGAKYWDEQPRNNNLHRHFNDDHRGNYNKSHKGHKAHR